MSEQIRQRLLFDEEQASPQQAGEPNEVTRQGPSAATQQPPAAPLLRQAIYRGAVLGAAIGDAMGHPTEFIGSFQGICDRYGPQGVAEFVLFWERDGNRFAPYTDDTQMAEVVLRSLLDGHDDLDAAMRRTGAGFVDWSENPQGGHRAPGNACMAGCRRLAQGVFWRDAGGETAGGCGSVMRAYPFGLVFADDLDKAERWAVEHSAPDAP